MGRLTGLAEGVAAAARRRQRDRAPRVVLFDAAGHPRVLAPGSPGFEEVVATAERMLALAGSADGRSRAEDGDAYASSTGGVSVPPSSSPGGDEN